LWQVSPLTPVQSFTSVEEAQEDCGRHGARLLQPRTKDLFAGLLTWEADYFGLGKQHPMFASAKGLTAIGLKMKIEAGQAIPYYYDGTPVDQNIRNILPWNPQGYPKSDPGNECVFLSGGFLMNGPCNGHALGKSKRGKQVYNYEV